MTGMQKGAAWLKVPPLARQLTGFVLVGLLRTVLGYVFYIALLPVMPYWLAFSICYVTTIVLSIFANGVFVFGASVTPSRALRYALVYCVNYTLSLAVLTFAVEILHLGPLIAPFCVIVTMFPLNFLGERYALTR